MAWEHAPEEVKELVREVARTVFHQYVDVMPIDEIVHSGLHEKFLRTDCRIFKRVVVQRLLDECKILPYQVPVSVMGYWLGLKPQTVKHQIAKYREFYRAKQKEYRTRKKDHSVQRASEQREGSISNNDGEPST
jgi:hypothetical protein